jgi:hypothetical protein
MSLGQNNAEEPFQQIKRILGGHIQQEGYSFKIIFTSHGAN